METGRRNRNASGWDFQSAVARAPRYCIGSEDVGLPLCTPVSLTREKEKRMYKIRGESEADYYLSFLFYTSLLLYLSPATSPACSLTVRRFLSPPSHWAFATDARCYLPPRLSSPLKHRRCTTPTGQGALLVDLSRPPDPVLLRLFSSGSQNPPSSRQAPEVAALMLH
jgi:hypothetical protein